MTPRPAATSSRPLVGGIAVAVTMIVLVALAIGVHRPVFMLLLLVGVSGTVWCVARALPNAAALTITLAACIPIYAAAFAMLEMTLFKRAHPFGVAAAFFVPLAGFTGSVVWRKDAIGRRLGSPAAARPEILLRGLGWLGACFAIAGAAALLVPVAAGGAAETAILLAAMLAMTLVTVLLAADVACLLAETGVLFRIFLDRMRHRVVPVFSFVVVFLFIGVVFATLYAILDRLAPVPTFSVGGQAASLSFPDAVYFSFVTLSTIGYGDITPIGTLARFLVMAEIVFGVVLLLFAFAEIIGYDRDGGASAAVDGTGSSLPPDDPTRRG
jgi:hypothetical protein